MGSKWAVRLVVCIDDSSEKYSIWSHQSWKNLTFLCIQMLNDIFFHEYNTGSKVKGLKLDPNNSCWNLKINPPPNWFSSLASSLTSSESYFLKESLDIKNKRITSIELSLSDSSGKIYFRSSIWAGNLLPSFLLVMPVCFMVWPLEWEKLQQKKQVPGNSIHCSHPKAAPPPFKNCIEFEI